MQKELVNRITELLLHGKWLTLYGPPGIGKRNIVQKVRDSINEKRSNIYLPIILDLSKVRANSTKELEDVFIERIVKHLNINIVKGLDLFDSIEKIFMQTKQRIILLLTNIDMVSYEVAIYISNEFRKIFHSERMQQHSRLTILISGGMGLNKFVFEKTSPFKTRTIKVEEFDLEETIEWVKINYPNIPDNMMDVVYFETRGYPGLLRELFESLPKDISNKNSEEIIHNFLDNAIDDKDEIKSTLFNGWFSHIDHPEFLYIIQKLLNNEIVKLKSLKLQKERIEVSGFLRIENNTIKFRNPLIEKFIKLYITPQRIADHFWIFSNIDSECWDEGCKIYSSISDDERKRVTAKVIGPVYKTLSDLITVGGTFMANKDSAIDIFSVLDNMLEYLFNINKYFICEKTHKEKDYKICFASKDSSYSLGNKVVDNEIIGLVKSCTRENRMFVHSWHHAYMVFPLIRGPGRQMVLWIDNKSGVVTQEYNHIIASLTLLTGLAVLQLEQKKRSKYLENELDLLRKVLEHGEDYVQVVDTERRIRMFNSKSEEDARILKPKVMDFMGLRCPDIFLNGKCSKNCACFQVFKDRQSHRRSETWPNPKDKSDIRYMDVNAVPIKSGEQIVGVLQIARDNTGLRIALEALINFSSAKTEEDVFKILLDAIIKVGAKRVRFFLPLEPWEKDGIAVGNLISKDCRGYEYDPKFEKKFRSGKYISDGKDQRYWYDAAKETKKPIISRLKKYLREPKIFLDNQSVLIYEVPLKNDKYRKIFKKEDVNEWICMRLFESEKFFGMVAVDKGPNGDPFRIFECDFMLAICRSAATALYRISVLGIRNVVRVFRHSIAQQLEVINQYIWTFAETDLSKDKRQSYAKLVDDEFQRIEYFSRNMTALLPEMGKFQISMKKLDIHKIIYSIRDLYEYYCKRSGITFNIIPETKFLSHINTDEMIVRIILYNLLDNAFESLTKWKGEKKVKVQCKEKNNKIIISVVDTGPGIDSEDQASIFDVGFSRKEASTGIGLPASRLVANWIGAEVKYDPNFRNGAKFDLILKI